MGEDSAVLEYDIADWWILSDVSEEILVSNSEDLNLQRQRCENLKSLQAWRLFNQIQGYKIYDCEVQYLQREHRNEKFYLQ